MILMPLISEQDEEQEEDKENVQFVRVLPDRAIGERAHFPSGRGLNK
jgi:hypothetical protein